MKKIFCLCSGLIFLSMTQMIFAQVSISASDPLPAIANSYNTGTKNTVIYTVTNNVPKSSFPMTISGISDPITRTTVSNDCGNTLPAGPSTCNIGISIAPTAAQAGSMVNQSFSISYQGRAPIVKKIVFSVTNPKPSAVLAAAGDETLSGDYFPLLVISRDSGDTWSKNLTLNQFVKLGYFTGVSCTGGLNAICVAAGGSYEGGNNQPLVVISTNGGISWSPVSSIGFDSDQAIQSTSCTGTGSDSICIAAGGNLLALGTNGGLTWKRVTTINTLMTQGNMLGASCSGNGADAVCTVVGYEIKDTMLPLLISSNNSGNTWSKVSALDFVSSGMFIGTTCAGIGSDTFCAAVGEDDSQDGNPYPLLVIKAGNAWSKVTFTDRGQLTGISCTGGGADAICAAVGQAYTKDYPSLLVVSRNGGAKWITIDTEAFAAKAILNGVSCTGNGSSAVCIAAGEDYTAKTSVPLLIVSTNGGVTWSKVTTTDFSAAGIFSTANCTGSGSDAVCTATGKDNHIANNPLPLLVVSKDGARTWSKVATDTFAVSKGSFSGGTATSSGSGNVTSLRSQRKSDLK